MWSDPWKCQGIYHLSQPQVLKLKEANMSKPLFLVHMHVCPCQAIEEVLFVLGGLSSSLGETYDSLVELAIPLFVLAIDSSLETSGQIWSVQSSTLKRWLRTQLHIWGSYNKASVAPGSRSELFNRILHHKGRYAFCRGLLTFIWQKWSKMVIR